MKILRLLIINWMIILIASCSNPTKEFNTATIKNTIQAYEDFIQKYPDDSLVTTAKAKICLLDYEKATLQNTIQAYEDFIQKYPNDSLVATAEAKMCILDYEKATKENTIQAFEYFNKKYPDDSLVIDAKFQICNLKNSIFEYEIFINKYPNSKYIGLSNDVMKKLLGGVKGRFVDENTNKLIKKDPLLFYIYEDNISDERKEIVDKLLKKYKIDVGFENNGNFIINNVVPGEYVIMIYIDGYGFKNVKVFNIEPNRILDLGEILIKMD